MFPNHVSLTWRKSLIIAACIITAGAGALALMADTKRDNAIASAKRYGKVVVRMDRAQTVTLLSRTAVNEVLPLLKDIPDLGELTIGGVDLTQDDMRTIGELTFLVALQLDGCNVSDDIVAPLGNLINTERLMLIRNPITDQGIRILEKMKGLKKIDLGATRVHGEGLVYLATLPNLKELWLTNALVDDTTIGVCAKIRRLEYLHFGQTAVTAVGLMKLVNMHWLRHVTAPDGMSASDGQKFLDAFIEARRKARAAGHKVPADDRPPFAIPT